MPTGAIVFSILILAVAMAWLFGETDLDKRAKSAHVLESLAVLGALLFAFSEYQMHYAQDQDRKMENSFSLIMKAIDTKMTHDAIAATNDFEFKPNETKDDLPKELKEFEAQTRPIFSYFIAAEICIDKDICNRSLAETLCIDFRLYYYKYRHLSNRASANHRMGWMNSLIAERDICPYPLSEFDKEWIAKNDLSNRQGP